MLVPEIIEVKELFDTLQKGGLVLKWELPYENILTRRNAAIFFFTPASGTPDNLNRIAEALSRFENFSFRINQEKKLSDLLYRVTFSKEEKEKNDASLILAESKSEN